MIAITEYAGQAVGVFGLGKAGQAAVEALLAGGARVFAGDDKEAASDKWQVTSKKEAYHLPLTTCHYADWPWPTLKALILSPGVPLTHPKPHPVVEMAKRHGVPVIGDIELLWRACPKAMYIGITGTNGKSTTTTLIGHILKEVGLRCEVGGNLGIPALSLEPLGEGGIYVLELSSYQLDLVKTAHFNIAVLLNITPDHLDRHGNMDGYVKAKMHIFDRQTLKDKAIIAIDDQYTSLLAEELSRKQDGARIVRVSAHQELSPGVYVREGMLYDKYHTRAEPGARFDLSGIVSLTGQHNWQNAAAACAAAYVVGDECGISPDAICKAMENFPGLRHRLQLAATTNGVRFINDSKATNADATANALAPYDHIYWIAGGKPKAGGIESLERYFPRVAHAFLIGEAEAEFARTLEGKVPYTRCGTLDRAVKQAAEMAFAAAVKEMSAVVLLSPACASFDQFRNFEERGDAFCGMVEALRPSGPNPQSLTPNPRGHYAP